MCLHFSLKSAHFKTESKRVAHAGTSAKRASKNVSTVPIAQVDVPDIADAKIVDYANMFLAPIMCTLRALSDQWH